ncbi:MFS transporter [Streptantibioticus ferralitis]|uniref:MFS transporter n=1 Tax=Streptantibioticus ferralitis TaxID=236510 RepID=A0ABT5Z2T4_9ACTN|nr:MFS transporter [Streptantibioticus ferralitis]MDF2258093.1 MFS transporter [Streptantibioticus ferralitis]
MRIPALLRERAFRRYWTGQTVSLLGDQVSQIAIPLTAVLTLHANAARMSWLSTAELLPALVFSLLVGALVDGRARRRQLMITADLGRALLLASLPIGYVLGGLSLGQLYGAAFGIGTLAVLFDVCDAALYPSLVPATAYVEGSSLLSGSRAMSFVVGPSIGGFLVQIFAAPVALLVDAVSYLVSAACLSRVQPVEPPSTRPGRGQLTAGLRWIARNRVMRATLAAVATVNFFNFVFFTLFALYATEDLHLQPVFLGAVLGAGAIGSVIGAFLTARLIRRIGIGPAVVAGCAAFPAPLLLVPLAGGPTPLVLALLFLAEFGSGFGVMVLDIAMNTLRAAIVPNTLRSSVMGAHRTLNYGVRSLGAMVAGVLGTVLGVHVTIWIGAAGALTAVLWLLPSPVPKLRELPEPAEERQAAPAGVTRVT